MEGGERGGGPLGGGREGGPLGGRREGGKGKEERIISSFFSDEEKVLEQMIRDAEEEPAQPEAEDEEMAPFEEVAEDPEEKSAPEPGSLSSLFEQFVSRCFTCM